MKKLLLTIACLLSLEVMHSNAQCGAGFTWFINSPTPTVVMFFDSSYGAGNLLYQWDFGDGATDTSYNPTHVYAGNGSYNVCLTITDTTGCTNTVCDSVVVQIPPPTVTVYDLMLDSMSFYNCIAPAGISFYFWANATGYSPTDSMMFRVSYGDGFDSTFYMSFANTSFYGTLTHQYQNSGTYTAQITATAPDQLADSAMSQSFVIAATCGNVSGKVYNDLNGNCAYDGGEEISGIGVYVLTSGGQLIRWANSDVNGDYSFDVPTGSTYDIQVVANGGLSGHFAPTCPPTGTINVSTVPSTGNNFGIACPVGYDLSGFVTGWRFRPGTVTSVCVNVYNQRCSSPNGQVDIILPTDLTPMPDTAGVGYTISGQTVSYTLSNSSLEWSFCFPVLVSASAQIGDSVCITMDIQPVVDDSVPSNNTGTFCFAVRNSYDPNDKAANPQGEGITGATLPNTDLTYTIRFQNTGNAEAINIYILDTLSADLDETSFEVIGTSHPVQVSLLAGNILRFNYDNIMLADSNTNEPASHGYVAYTIKQKTNLVQGTAIENTAGIYFDFNPPVITNTTLNTVDWSLSTPSIENQSSILSAYPNPSNDKCQLLFSNNHMKVVSVMDAVGKEVFRATVSSDNYQLNTGKFADGSYSIRILENGIASGNLKLLILH